MYREVLSAVSFLSSVVIAFIALFIPPSGIIDSSVLWFTSQLLLFCCSLLGIKLDLKKLSNK